MSKTLVISRVFPPQVGGSGRWLWEMYRRLPHEDFVIAAGDHPGATAFDSTHDLDVHRFPLSFPDYGILSPAGFNRYRRVAQQILQLAREQGAAAIHCGTLYPDGWIGRMVAKKLRLPFLMYLHGEEVCYANSSRQLDWMARRVLRDADQVVVNSSNTRQIALDHWRLPAKKVQVIHPGVDTARFVPAERNEQVREGLRWGKRPVILTVGRLEKRKGHDMLLRALPAIRQQLSVILYAIAGDGDERPRLEQLTEELGLNGHVCFHGEPSDDQLVQMYQQCDLFVLPNRTIGSDIEGFGIVLLEAQSSGKPVIAGDSGGTREAMQISQTGIVVDCSDPCLIAAEVSRLLSDPPRLRAMGRLGREWVCQAFDWQVGVAQAEQLFRNLIPQPAIAAARVG